MASRDGVALYSTSHPRPSLWRRIWFWLFPPHLHDDALETIEIEIPDEDRL